MGGWRLEIAKMALYITFPVGTFYYFNRPEFFEEWVVKTRREMYPPEDSPDLVDLRNAIKEIQKKQELDRLKSLEGGQAL